MINLKLDEDLQYRLDDGIINLIDDKELINAMVSENVYDKLQFNFYTLDINAERLTKNSSVKSDPWFLIYNFVTSEKFDCTYQTDIIKNKFISLISLSDTDTKVHRFLLVTFLRDNEIDCCYSHLQEGKTLTEIPDHYPNGYFKNLFDYGVPKEYFESCIDIVAESYAKFSTHYSEKTYKPIFYKKPFITLAGPYYYKTLKEYGFENYDEIFDYDFDNEENLEKRIDNILNQIETLNELSLNDIKNLCKKVEPKIEHNYQNIKKQKPIFTGPRERVVILKTRR